MSEVMSDTLAAGLSQLELAPTPAEVTAESTAPPGKRLPWDLIFLIANAATASSGALDWQATQFEVAKLDENSGWNGSRELKAWREHYATCCALTLTCRFLHTATIPRLWQRVAVLKKMSSAWLADLARTTSEIAPSSGVAPLRPFGLYTRELTLWRLLRPPDNQATVTHLKAFQPVFPYLESLTLGAFIEDRFPNVVPALGNAWPRLRSLRRVPRMLPGSQGRFADELARLPCLEELTMASGSQLSSRAIEALRLNTILVNPLTGRAGTGLASLLLGAGVIRDEATLFQVLSACPNLTKLHVAGAGSQMRWSSLDLARFLDRLNPRLMTHLGFRPYGPTIGNLRHILKRLPRLEYLSLRPTHVDFDLFQHASDPASCLRHLELRDAATDNHVPPPGGEQLPSLSDEGFVWSGRSQIVLGSRRALEAARAGFGLDRNLVLRLMSVVSIESTLTAQDKEEGGKDVVQAVVDDEADETAAQQGLWMDEAA